MKTKLFTALVLAALSTTTFGATTVQAAAGADAPLESRSGKATHCTAKVKFANALDQTLVVDTLRIKSATDGKFFTEFKLGGTRYRPVSGATVRTPELDVQVPAGHELAFEITYRTQRTAGKNPTWSKAKSDSWGAGVLAPTCSLEGRTHTLTIN